MTVEAAPDETKAVKGRCVGEYGPVSHHCVLRHADVVSCGDVGAIGEGVCRHGFSLDRDCQGEKDISEHA